MVWTRSLILLGLAIGVILTGCGETTQDGGRSYGDSLVIVTYHAPAGINPLTSVSGISTWLTDIVFDSLVWIGQEEARPSLASSWQVSEDGLRWTFFLRRGVKFHDGVEFTAEDVKFTLEEIIHSNRISPLTGELASIIRSVHIRDRYTVEIILKRPSLFLIYSLEVGILPAHIMKKRGCREKFGSRPIGTGPFKLSRWEKDEIIFEANRDYFPGRPYLDRILVKVYPDQELAWARLMRGEGDFFGPVDPKVHDFLKQVNSLQIKTRRFHYSMIAFNNDRDLFRERRVRTALNYAIDKEHLVLEVLKGNGETSSGTIWPGSRFYNPSVRPHPYDPQKALSLLREAGWEDRDGDHILDKGGRRFAFTLLINEGDEIKEHAAMQIQQQLWELGIRMDIKMFSTASMDFLFQGRFDAVFIDIFSHIYPDFSYNIWHSSQIRTGFNIGRYRSKRADELLERGRISRDTEEAREIYYRFQEVIHDDPPGIFLYWADGLIGIHKRFRGVRFPPVRLMAGIAGWYVPEGEQKYSR